MQKAWSKLLCFSAVFLFIRAGAAQPSLEGIVTSLAGLQSSVAGHGCVIQSFRVEGVACAVVSQRNLVALQDDTACVLLELPSVGGTVTIGDRLMIEGEKCPLTQTRFGIQVGTAPVVDNDGTHYELTKSGSVFLGPGVQPIRIMWFNGQSDPSLSVEYEGPGVPRQSIPAAALWHRLVVETNQDELGPGVRYLAYEGDGWLVLPDFSRLTPVATGIATGFNTACRSRADNCGLVFDGCIRVDHPGLYTFYLRSSDGSRLYAGDPDDRCKVVSLGRKADPNVTVFESASSVTPAGQWTALEGEVTFAGRNKTGWELELSFGAESVQAMVLGDSPALGADLLHQRVQAMGICEASPSPNRRQLVRMIIPSPDQIHIRRASNATNENNISSDEVLTSARQIQRLKSQQAQEKIRVRIKGVITQASLNNLVLQDATGGVFIHYYSTNWTGQPQVGDYWEVEGTTDPGDFSPVVFATRGRFLGNATLPEPVQPTWDQLMNGSLDAQYIEIHGVVLSVSDDGMVILTPDGEIKATVDEMRRLYAGGHDAFINIHGELEPDAVSKSYEGCVVRIRGCVAAVWNRDTRQVKAGEIRLVAAVVSVEQPRPANPFVLPARKVTDLLLFDPRAGALQRTKVAGQIVYVQPHEYLIQDGTSGLHARLDETLSLRAGDFVEAVGFPQLGGPSPVLLAAQLRKTGAGPLPVPVRISPDSLLNRGLDSTRVEIESVLLSDTTHRDERVLELQAGPHHYLARICSRQDNEVTLPPGSQLQLTGVYSSAWGDRGNGNSDPFELLLDNAGGIVVLQQPSWWTVRHAVTVMAVLAAALGMALIWAALLRRKVEERTRQLQKEIEERQLVEQHRAIEQERTRVAQDLHDDLGAGLTEMSILGSLAKTPAIPPEIKGRYLDQLTQTARSLVTSLDEIVWAINPNYDSVPSLVTYFSLFAQRFLNLAGIACRLQVAEQIPEHPLDSKLRHGVFCAFKEALNNVIRHSGATEVRLVIQVEAGRLMLYVIDNGRGFESFDAAPGKDGLAGLAWRMQKLGGDCHITSRPGRGTTVEFCLPLNSNHHG